MPLDEEIKASKLAEKLLGLEEPSKNEAEEERAKIVRFLRVAPDLDLFADERPVHQMMLVRKMLNHIADSIENKDHLVDLEHCRAHD